MFFIVLLYALFAGTFSLGKLILAYTQPIFLVGVRMSIAGMLLLGYHYIIDRRTSRISKYDYWLFVQAIIFANYLPYMLRYWGLAYVPSSKACLLYNFGPFVTFVLSYFMYTEKVTIKKVLGLIIGFVGLIPLVNKGGGCAADSYPIAWLPDLAIICATAASSYGWLIIHQLIRKQQYTVPFINGMTMGIGGFLALATSIFMERQTGFVTDFVPFLTILAVIIVISNLVCHNLYASLLRKYSPTLISFAQFLSPIFAALYGWLFLHEPITWQFIISASVVFCGLSLFYQEELRYGEPLFKATTDDASSALDTVELEA